MHKHTLLRRLTAPSIAILAAFVFAPLPWSGSAAAADYHLGSLQITQPWARATPQGASSGAAYMTVTNTGTKAERVSCVSSDAAAKCEIHEMTMDGGVMRMRPVEGGLEIKPGETVTLKPGGFHMMLTGLKAPLQQGKTLEATLQGDGGQTVHVEFPISPVGAPGPDAGSGHMMMQGPGMAPMSH
jgi:periplasmic copper chaperone A